MNSPSQIPPFDSSNTIFLGGLPLDAQEADIKHFFKPYGKIKFVCLKKKHEEDTQNLGYGFIIVADERSMMSILSRQFYKLRGRKIEVSQYMKKSEKRDEKFMERLKKRLYIRGLPAFSKEGELKKHFSRYGAIQNLFLLNLEEGRRTRDCFVMFESAKAARRVETEAKMGILEYKFCGLVVHKGKDNISKKSSLKKKQKKQRKRRQKERDSASKQLDRRLERGPGEEHFSPKNHQKSTLTKGGDFLTKHPHRIDQNSPKKAYFRPPKYPRTKKSKRSAAYLPKAAIDQMAARTLRKEFPEGNADFFEDFSKENFNFYKKFYQKQILKRQLKGWDSRPSKQDHFFSKILRNHENKQNLQFNI